MSKTFLYRIFKIGEIPQNLRSQINREGIVLQEEGIGGSVTFKKIRAPGKYHGWRRNWFSGSIVLTREHFLAFQFTKPIIGVSWNHEKINCLNCFLENENTLCVEFDAGNFNENWSGDVTVKFSTPLARLFLENIEQLITYNKRISINEEL